MRLNPENAGEKMILHSQFDSHFRVNENPNTREVIDSIGVL
jgi:hypothetical protein